MKKIVISSILAALLLTGCKPPQEAEAASTTDSTTVEKPKDPVAVEAVIAYTGEIAKEINGSVTTAGIREVFLSAKGNGTIVSVPVKMGQRLRRGNTILAVESHVQKAALTQAQVGVDQAKLNFNAVEQLYEKGSVSEAEFIQAKSMLSSAEAGFEMSQYNYKNCWLRAPFSGALTYLDPVAEKGNMVGAGTPVARMVDISKLKLRLYFGESEIINIAKGNKASLNVPALGETLTGTVTAVAEGSDPATGSFSVEVITDNPDEKVKAGMTGRVTIYTDNTQSGFILPASAVIIRGDNRYVMKTVDGKTVSIPVTTSLIKNNRMLVVGEISEGDTLVTTGLTRLIEGDQVTPTLVEM